jgi:hypothetical protein
MHWLRSNIRLGARLALFALAVQIVLAFGHVHFDAFALAPAGSAAAATAQDTALQSNPAPVPKSNGSLGADCAICALIQLSAALAPATAPTVPLPTNRGPLALPAPAALALATSPHFLFQARAPPSI